MIYNIFLYNDPSLPRFFIVFFIIINKIKEIKLIEDNKKTESSKLSTNKPEIIKIINTISFENDSNAKIYCVALLVTLFTILISSAGFFLL